MPEFFYDKENQYYYTMSDGKKMYIPKRFTLKQVIRARAFFPQGAYQGRKSRQL